MYIIAFCGPPIDKVGHPEPCNSRILNNRWPTILRTETPPPRTINVFMMDLWTTVPYYDAYLCRALASENLSLTLGAITYYLDPMCFARLGVRNDPGLLDVVGKFKFPTVIRRSLKFLESGINMAALAVKFVFTRPDIVHIQFLPMLRWRLPIDFWYLKFMGRLGIKLVYTVHDILPHDTGEQHKILFQRLYSMVDLLICHSDVVRQELITEFGIQP
jgi:hypothetical protein